MIAWYISDLAATGVLKPLRTDIKVATSISKRAQKRPGNTSGTPAFLLFPFLPLYSRHTIPSSDTLLTDVELEQPMLAVENEINPDNLSTSMTILTFSQTLGGSVLLAFASVILSEGLKDLIPRFAPDVDPADIIATGARGSAVL
ncbi:hypothetical protein BDV06DRAFT_226189 [Aspergillus oleicola]